MDKKVGKYALVVLITEVPSGYVADMIGRKQTLVIGAVFCGIGHTLLLGAEEAGLELLTRKGEWKAIRVPEGALVINVGDMLQETSGGYFPSTTHRVINPTGEGSSQSRLSLPLFLHPRPEVVLSDKHTADSYLKERLRELGVI